MAAHNKSGLVGLSLLSHSDQEIMTWVDGVENLMAEAPSSPIPGSPCYLLPAADGKFSHGGKKTPGYHIVAFGRFGRLDMETVSSAKKGKGAITISHLCGTANCCNESHMVLELKEENDQRTHCHYSLANIRLKNGDKGVQTALDLGLCPHDPPCCKASF